ncbi:antibiotic biosynthesis monooxygenase [Actinoplanes philippinensis]|uniref:antibiotic biosynthesis monooxygenase n=1 Tax=Actinoplanes philippinensis TaxID=35752 RepID=UPI0033DC2003
MRVLAQAVHYPKPEHRDDIIAAMGRLRAASSGVAGLEEIGGFEDPEGGRIIAISVWSSMEAMQAGMATLGAAIADVPFAEWERQAPSLAAFPQVA